jgi:hypothetical protein
MLKDEVLAVGWWDLWWVDRIHHAFVWRLNVRAYALRGMP